MITGTLPFWLLVLLACAVPIVIFGLLVRKMPVISGLVIAAMVLCIIGAALSIGRPGPFAKVWPGHVHRHVRVPPVPSLAPEIHLLEQRLSEVGRKGAKMAAQGLRHAVEVALEAEEELKIAFPFDDGPVLTVAGVPDAPSPRMYVEVAQPGSVEIQTTLESLSTNPRRSRVRHLPVSLALLLPSLLTALSIGAFLAVGYVFLDAGTRGQFTWSLRIASVVAFAAICVAISALRQQL